MIIPRQFLECYAFCFGCSCNCILSDWNFVLYVPVGLLDFVCLLLDFVMLLFLVLHAIVPGGAYSSSFFFFFFTIHSSKFMVINQFFPSCFWCLAYEEFRQDEFSFGNRAVTHGGNQDREGALMSSKMGSSSTTELRPKTAEQSKPTSMPPASVMTRLILIMVWRKLIRNPNTYSSLIGLTWSLVSFKYALFICPTHFSYLFLWLFH